jgi:hypothetical protein
MSMPIALSMCARCVAGLCGHDECRTPGWGKPPVTDVAGTSCCGDCAPVLLELVLHPLRVIDVSASDPAGQIAWARQYINETYGGGGSARRGENMHERGETAPDMAADVTGAKRRIEAGEVFDTWRQS